MRALSRELSTAAIETKRAIGGADEQLFGSDRTVLSSVARTLWPHKTAAHLAAATNCSVRAAEMYLGGQREWSGDAIAAIVSEILKRHAMRNVKVSARR